MSLYFMNVGSFFFHLACLIFKTFIKKIKIVLSHLFFSIRTLLFFLSFLILYVLFFFFFFVVFLPLLNDKSYCLLYTKGWILFNLNISNVSYTTITSLFLSSLFLSFEAEWFGYILFSSKNFTQLHKVEC